MNHSWNLYFFSWYWERSFSGKPLGSKLFTLQSFFVSYNYWIFSKLFREPNWVNYEMPDWEIGKQFWLTVIPMIYSYCRHYYWATRKENDHSPCGSHPEARRRLILARWRQRRVLLKTQARRRTWWKWTLVDLAGDHDHYLLSKRYSLPWSLLSIILPILPIKQS